jgi:DNA-binding NarL/FixJ family response regulator
MKPIRVLVANRPRLLRELVMATISDQPDIEIVGEVEQESELGMAVDQAQPDFVIVALDRFNHLPRACQSVLEHHPHMRVIAIAANRNFSMFYWTSLRIQSNQIESSEAGVLSALRSEMQSTPGAQQQ